MMKDDIRGICPIPGLYMATSNGRQSINKFRKAKKTYYSEEAYREDKALAACKVQAYTPLVDQEAPFRASYAGGNHQFEVIRPNNHLDIPGVGTHKEDKRIRIHELPRLELQNLLHTTEEE